MHLCNDVVPVVEEVPSVSDLLDTDLEGHCSKVREALSEPDRCIDQSLATDIDNAPLEAVPSDKEVVVQAADGCRTVTAVKEVFRHFVQCCGHGLILQIPGFVLMMPRNFSRLGLLGH